MAKTLNLRISYPEIRSEQTEAIRPLNTHELQLRYQSGHYQLIQGEQVIFLHDGQLLTLGNLIINIQQEELASSETIAETPTPILNNDYHIPSPFENSLATEVAHRMSPPLEYEVAPSTIPHDDPLAFLYASQSTLQTNKTHQPYPEKIQQPEPLSLLNQHFQAPIAVIDDICERPMQTIHKISESSEQKNILKAIKNFLPETKKKPIPQAVRFKNPIIIKA